MGRAQHEPSPFRVSLQTVGARSQCLTNGPGAARAYAGVNSRSSDSCRMCATSMSARSRSKVARGSTWRENTARCIEQRGNSSPGFPSGCCRVLSNCVLLCHDRRQCPQGPRRKHRAFKGKLVLPHRIELWTSPLPRGWSSQSEQWVGGLPTEMPIDALGGKVSMVRILGAFGRHGDRLRSGQSPRRRT